MPSPSHTVWSSELSPFGLKVRAILDHAGMPYRWRPARGGRLENFRTARRVQMLRRGRLPVAFPEMSGLDELPSVPFVLGDDGQNVYDSTAIADWVSRTHPSELGPLIPDDPLLCFLARLIDEYFDELGLYMAHHNRWVVAATDNDAGWRLAGEFAFLFPGPMRYPAAEWFSARQVRRLPYLFSVADPSGPGPAVSARRRPPSREGFPPTHELLDMAFLRTLERVELVLSDQEYLLGSAFTLADASAYGQLCMNTHDAAVNALMELRAPLTHAWVKRIEKRMFARPRPGSPLVLGDRLAALLEEIGRVFVPLMKQNAAAYERHYEAGQRRFNEAAFDAGEALYDGELDGVPFRSVAKSFQVVVWRRLLEQYRALDAKLRARLPLSLE